MRKLFAYILASVTLAACTSEDMLVEEIDVQEPTIEVDSTGVWVSKPQPIMSGFPIGSRSSLAFDKFAGNIMTFGWSASDNISVFKYEAEHPQPIQFVQTAGNSEGSLACSIKSADENIKYLLGNTEYVAYYPYHPKEDFDGYSIDVKYTDQVQTASVDMRHYFDTKETMTADNETARLNYQAYKDSEKNAAAHLNNYDYMCAPHTKTRAMGGITFPMKRMGAIVRFYIKSPKEDMVYTELQLYNESEEFTLEGTINVQNSTLTPTKTSHVMKLKLGVDGNGFDIGVNGNTNPFYKLNGDKAYLVAYMMLGPVDLSSSTEHPRKKSILYLIAHDKNVPANVHYYKAELSAQPNLYANILHQWQLSGNEPDNAIEFTETTVEEWTQATGYDNGDGKGTESW